MRLTTTSRPGNVPELTYGWNAETRILAGRFPVPEQRGFTGMVEVTGDDGAIVVLDVRGGLLAGFEIVVWPGAELHPQLDPPDAEAALVGVVSHPEGVAGALELETVIEADATPDRSTIHVLVGGEDAVRAVRVARDLIVELDASDRLAGLWLTNVPPAPGAAA